MLAIMGAGAFIMAQFLGVDYIMIAMEAIIPALLYYISVYFAVHAETLTQGIKSIPDENIPGVRNGTLSAATDPRKDGTVLGF